jgi:hypothetical protein
MKSLSVTVLLLVISNTFMTFAWYAHLKNLADQPWIIAALVSWGTAFFEYLFQVPANRIGYGTLSLPQLKIIQEAIALIVFVPFSIFYMRQSWSWNYLWAALCVMGAVFFIFQEPARTGPPPMTAPCAEAVSSPLPGPAATPSSPDRAPSAGTPADAKERKP